MKLLPRNRPLRYAVLAGFGVLGFVCVVGVMRWNIARESAAKLKAVCDQLDREDPGWRFEEMLAADEKPLPGINSFSVLEQIHEELRNNEPLLNDSYKESYPWPPNEKQPWLAHCRRLPEPMPQEAADWFGEWLAKRQTALRLARSLADLPRGRHTIHHRPDALSSRIDNRTEDANNLLRFDLHIACQLRDFPSALRDIHALYNLSNSFGDGLYSHLWFHHQYDLGSCMDSMMELLAAGRPPAEHLDWMAGVLAKEATDKGIAQPIRVARAIVFQSMRFNALKSSIVKPAAFDVLPGNGNWDFLNLSGLIFRYVPYQEADQAAMLEMMTRTLELSSGSDSDFFREMKRLKKTGRTHLEPGKTNSPTLLTDLLRDCIGSWGIVHTRNRMKLAATATAIAAERFHQANNHWPDNLDALVPRFLDTVPVDAFDDQPMRYRRIEDGVIIYSIDRDEKDDSGDVLEVLDRSKSRWQFERPKDIGFRLWNPELRGKETP